MILPRIIFPRVGRVPAVVKFGGNFGNCFERFAQRSGIFGVIVYRDFCSGFAVVINPFGVDDLKAYTSAGSASAEHIIFIRQHCRRICFPVTDRMEQIIPAELAGILSISAVNHEAPLFFHARDRKCPQRRGMSFPACGTDHSFHRDSIISVVIKAVNRNRIGGAVDTDIIRTAVVFCRIGGHGIFSPGRGHRQRKEYEQQCRQDTAF